jgi:hypothetical protein
VADAKVAGRVSLAYHLAQVFDAASLAIHVDTAVGPQRNACGIIATIFKSTQPVEKDGACLTFADVTNDATHSEMEGVFEIF